MANELQIALFGLGAALVGSVWAYNKWQERGHRQRAEKLFGGTQEDVLMAGTEAVGGSDDAADAVRREPSFGTPELAGSPASSAPPEAKGPPAPPPNWADEVADCVLRIEFVEAVAAPALWSAQSPWASLVAKPLRWLGFDDAAEQWKLVSAHDAGRYSMVVAALQLADRNGAASDAEIGTFLDGAHQLAQQFSGLVELPSRHEVLTHAQALDQFCAGVDMQLSVAITAAKGGVMQGTRLRGLAEATGLGLQDDGFFHLPADDGTTLFVLGNAGAELFNADSLRSLATTGVTLTLDVPRVGDGPAAFDRMIAVARQLAQSLDGSLVDATHQRALDDAMIAGIRSRIGEIQQRMQANQISPGSVRALRLFS